MPDLRISAGELKGRKLSTGSGRPTTGRVREAIFSALGQDLGSQKIDRVLDLYCGSGAMGFESLSRGARSLVLVDRDPGPAIENVEALGVDVRVEVRAGSVIEVIGTLPPHEFDLIFCDPPYRLAATEMEAIEPKLSAALAPSGRLVVEGPAGEGPYVSLPLLFDRTYGRTRVTIHGVSG
jgi:16S rRNA (guanine966-N2)-methyltransferase